MRVWERAGVTEACGTGACASAITAITKGLTEQIISIHWMVGFKISYNPEQPLFMEGDMILSFRGDPYER